MARLAIPLGRRADYVAAICSVLGIDSCSARVILEEKSGSGGDVRLESECASDEIRIAYWPEGLRCLGERIGAAQDDLAVVGFIECLTFGILQRHWSRRCLNSCETCRFRWPNRAHRLRNTLLTYYVTQEVLPAYRDTIDTIIRAVCGDSAAGVHDALSKVRLADVGVASVSFRLRTCFQANLLFHILRKYALLPPHYGAYYAPSPAAASSLAVMQAARTEIHEAVRGPGDDAAVLRRIAAIKMSAVVTVTRTASRSPISRPM